MSASNAFESALLDLIFTNVAVANVGDAGGLQPSATAGVFYVSLHSSGVDDTSDQSTSEATYTGYSSGGRQAPIRSTSDWTVSSGTVTNDNAITFGPCTGGTTTVHSFILGSDSTGAGHAFIWGNLNSDLAVSSGITPSFAATTGLSISVD